MIGKSAKAGQAEALRDRWREDWPEALAAWSRFTKLSEPRWCITPEEEKTEQLTDSFAMIRLVDHRVVIGITYILARGLDNFGKQILAHEIGHHVYAPADLADNARLLARIRAGLPTREPYAPLVANFYTDLLINDRLQRDAGLDMASVYAALKLDDDPGELWTLYMRIYEILWGLPAGTLAPKNIPRQIQGDAQLGARLIRAYSRDWIGGAGRFAVLCLTYLLKEPEAAAKFFLVPWTDALGAGEGGEIPDGLAEIDPDEIGGAIHPADDEALTGLGAPEDEDGDDKAESRDSKPRGGRAIKGGIKERYRSPAEYAELMKGVGVKVSEKELIIKYYRERAVPHLIKFPARLIAEAADPLPEGTEEWDAGSPLSEIDWMETMIKSPEVIPGVTTVRRTYGYSQGNSPEKVPPDLYIGVDCSGSMMNPAYDLSYPVLAGAIISLSALRAGARVKAVLSGESPGNFSETGGFVRSEREVLKILTGYHGTGYSFGVMRLHDAFLAGDKLKRQVHILIVTDSDIFHMLKETKNGWEIAHDALYEAGGGGTLVLNIASPQYWEKDLAKLTEQGWSFFFVSDWKEMIAFARAFSKMKYENDGGGGGR